MPSRRRAANETSKLRHSTFPHGGPHPAALAKKSVYGVIIEWSFPNESVHHQSYKGLNAAGLTPELVDEQYYPPFGDGVAIFQIAGMRLKFSSDRSWNILEIASTKSPDRFYVFADVEIAMGWKSVEEAIASLDVPEQLSDIICQLERRLSDLQIAFAGSADRFERATLLRAAQEGFLPPFSA